MIRLCRRHLLSLLPLLWLASAGALAAPTDGARTEARQLLELLGISAVLAQTPNAVAYAINAEREARGVSAREASGWQRRVALRVNDKQLREAIVARVVAERIAAGFRHAHALLEQPPARRVRYFEEAMGQRGAAANLRDFFQSPPTRQPPPARLALLQSLDEASSSTELVALLQTLAARAVRGAAGLLTTEPPATEEVAVRQRWLRPRLLDYQRYSYRYLKDEDLAAYLEVLRAPQVQQVVTAAVMALQDQLAALDAQPEPVTPGGATSN